MEELATVEKVDKKPNTTKHSQLNNEIVDLKVVTPEEASTPVFKPQARPLSPTIDDLNVSSRSLLYQSKI